MRRLRHSWLMLPASAASAWIRSRIASWEMISSSGLLPRTVTAASALRSIVLFVITRVWRRERRPPRLAFRLAVNAQDLQSAILDPGIPGDGGIQQTRLHPTAMAALCQRLDQRLAWVALCKPSSSATPVQNLTAVFG